MFIFCGHGAGEVMGSPIRYHFFTRTPAAMLWGCSSGRLRPAGVFDPSGPALHYLLTGAPFVVGNLWNVKSFDVDDLSMHFMRNCLPRSQNLELVGPVDLAEALVQARRVCKFKYANGCAPVLYGICQKLKE